MAKTELKRKVLAPLFIMGLVIILWVLGLGLDQWPFGQYSRMPRIFPLGILITGIMLTTATSWIWGVKFRSRRAVALALSVTLIFGFFSAWGVRKVVRWRATIWMEDFLLKNRTVTDVAKSVDVLFCFVDHFEPGGLWKSPEEFPTEQRLSIMRNWEKLYSEAIEGHRDSDGRIPQTTWLFPISHSESSVAEKLAQWPKRGWGEIEYHLHHRADWDGNRVRQQTEQDLAALLKIGACTNGYAFVHGVYGLAAGDPRVCKVVEELDILRDTGCYADFTFPNIYTPAQPSQINSIFYAKTTGLPKPHDRGVEVSIGGSQDGLMLIQGPMWAGFTMAVLDDGNLSIDQPPDPSRIDHWMAAHISVKGRPNWIFIVVHTHSATDYAQAMLFDGNMQKTWSALETRFKNQNHRLHYVTARETYNIVKAAEAGLDGNPDRYRDFLIKPPANRSISTD